jgi:hypothetical protein
VLREYEQEYRLGSDGDYLRTVSDLRNVVVHEETEPHGQMGVPTVVARLEAICGWITKPARVVPRFQRSVETMTPDDSLAHVLRTISKRDYSQFPVFVGKDFADC